MSIRWEKREGYRDTLGVGLGGYQSEDTGPECTAWEYGQHGT